MFDSFALGSREHPIKRRETLTSTAYMVFTRPNGRGLVKGIIFPYLPNIPTHGN